MDKLSCPASKYARRKRGNLYAALYAAFLFMVSIPSPECLADLLGNATQQHREQHSSDEVEEAERVSDLRAVHRVRHNGSQLVPYVGHELLHLEPVDDTGVV